MCVYVRGCCSTLACAGGHPAVPQGACVIIALAVRQSKKAMQASSPLDFLRRLWLHQTPVFRQNILFCMAVVILSRVVINVIMRTHETPATRQLRLTRRVGQALAKADPASRRHRILQRYAAQAEDLLLDLMATPADHPTVLQFVGLVPNIATQLFFSFYRSNRVVCHIPMEDSLIAQGLNFFSGAEKYRPGNVSAFVFMYVAGRVVTPLLNIALPPGPSMTKEQRARLKARMATPVEPAANSAPEDSSARAGRPIDLREDADLRDAFPDIAELSDVE